MVNIDDTNSINNIKIQNIPEPDLTGNKNIQKISREDAIIIKAESPLSMTEPNTVIQGLTAGNRGLNKETSQLIVSLYLQDKNDLENARVEITKLKVDNAVMKEKIRTLKTAGYVGSALNVIGSSLVTFGTSVITKLISFESHTILEKLGWIMIILGVGIIIIGLAKNRLFGTNK